MPIVLQKPRSARALLLMGVVWLLAIAGACAADRPVAEGMNRTSIPLRLQSPDRLKPLARVWKEPGEYRFWIVVGVVIAFVHPLRWRAGAWTCLGAGAGLHTVFIKWIVGRTRPFKLDPETLAQPFVFQPFRGGWHGFLHQANLSFPSGHASTAFAGAAALGILFPRWRWCFYALAAAVGVERVLELGHWCSDVVGGAAISVLLVHGLWKVLFNIVPNPAVTSVELQ